MEGWPSTWASSALRMAGNHVVDRSVERRERPSQNVLRQRVARHHGAGVLDKDEKRLEFRPRQRKQGAVRGANLGPPHVDRPGSGCRNRLGAAGGGRRRRARASHHGAQPGQELPRIERLHDEIVGAGFERDDPVGPVLVAGQHDDPATEETPQPDDHRQRILPLDELVQDEDRGLDLFQAGHQIGQDRDMGCHEAMGVEELSHFFRVVLVVFDEYHVLSAQHGRMLLLASVIGWVSPSGVLNRPGTISDRMV